MTLIKAVAKPAKKDGLSFEDGMEKLESLVEKMESAQLPLEEIIQSYEEGMKLVQFCGEKLKAAEVKIELLTRDKSGTVTRSELPDTVGAEGFAEEKAASRPPAVDDEASLF